MPFINLKTNKEMSKSCEAELREDFSKHIELLPGKTDFWLMQCFEDNMRMSFRSITDEPMAIIEVSLLGAAKKEAYDALTAALTKSVSEKLGVRSDRIYVKYSEISTWGYDGENF